MPPVLNTVTLDEFTDLVNRTWQPMMAMVPEAARQLFIVDSMPANQGDKKRYTEIDVETYANIKREGESMSSANVQVGYSKDMQAKRVAREIAITWEMRNFNRYPQVTGQLTSLAHFVPQRMELDLTHRLTFAESTTYTDRDGDTVSLTGGDGLAMVSSVHTLTGVSTTWSNVITGNPVFSKGGLEAAETVGNVNILSNLGERRVMEWNTIATSDDPNTVNTVKEYLNSTADLSAPNSGVVNVYKNKYKHVVLPQLATTATGAYDSTKAKRWFLMSTGRGVMGWQAYLGVWENPTLHTPATGNNAEDFSTQNWSYGTTGTYGICAVTGRGILMSTGLGSQFLTGAAMSQRTVVGCTQFIF